MDSQARQLVNYNKMKQYNHEKIEKVMYPNYDTFKNFGAVQFQDNDLKKVNSLMLTTKRERPHALDLARMSYKQQKEFFKLDQEYDRIFIEQHQHKISVKKDPHNKALMSKLKQERTQMFR